MISKELVVEEIGIDVAVCPIMIYTIKVSNAAGAAIQILALNLSLIGQS